MKIYLDTDCPQGLAIEYEIKGLVVQRCVLFVMFVVYVYTCEGRMTMLHWFTYTLLCTAANGDIWLFPIEIATPMAGDAIMGPAMEVSGPKYLYANNHQLLHHLIKNTIFQFLT